MSDNEEIVEVEFTDTKPNKPVEAVDEKRAKKLAQQKAYRERKKAEKASGKPIETKFKHRPPPKRSVVQSPAPVVEANEADTDSSDTESSDEEIVIKSRSKKQVAEKKAVKAKPAEKADDNELAWARTFPVHILIPQVPEEPT
jgi:hypothetical protein